MTRLKYQEMTEDYKENRRRIYECGTKKYPSDRKAQDYWWSRLEAYMIALRTLEEEMLVADEVQVFVRSYHKGLIHKVKQEAIALADLKGSTQRLQILE